MPHPLSGKNAVERSDSKDDAELHEFAERIPDERVDSIPREKGSRPDTSLLCKLLFRSPPETKEWIRAVSF